MPAVELFSRMVKQVAEQKGVTENERKICISQLGARIFSWTK